MSTVCWFLLTEARYLPARLIQTAPPGKRRSHVGSYAIVDLDLSKYDRLASRFAEESRRSTSLLKGGIETRNAAFQ